MNDGCAGPEKTKRRSVELPILDTKKTTIRDSRTSVWRAGVLILLNLLMIAHVVQWFIMGRTISPIEPSEAMYTLRDGAVNAGFIFFTIAILATLIFGRFVCGWGCHIVALQDLCGWLLKKIGLTPKPFRSRLLVFVPLIVALYMFVYPVVLRAFFTPPNVPVIPGFTNHLVTTEFWATFPPIAVAIPFLFSCGFLTVYFLGQKGFCTYACPYGGFFSVADKVAPGRIRVTDACEGCGHCTAVCTSNVLVHKEVKEYGMVVDQGCMKCMDCVSVCPNDALYFGFGKPAVGTPNKISKNYSLTWPEEIVAAIVFAASYMAVWDVYQLVPMLMALGIASVTTFLVMRLVRLVRSSDLTFYRYVLKSRGKMKRAGWIFAALATVWVGINAHSGFIRYYEALGTRAFEAIKISDELSLARPNPARWISGPDRQNMIDGARNLHRAHSFGLFTNAEALPKLAWIEYLSGNTETAVGMLADAAPRQRAQGSSLSLYYRGAMLNRLGRADEALTDLDAALAISPGLILASEEKGEALWRLGRKEEAESVWRTAIADGDRLLLAKHFLAAAAKANNRTDAADLQSKADMKTPTDPLLHWVIGLRLENIGLKEAAEREFQIAIRINPEFRRALQPAPR